MSARYRVSACPRYPKAVRYRNERQARAGRDRTRTAQLAAGLPPALCATAWYRCGACRGWHLRGDRKVVAAFFHDLHVAAAQTHRLLDAAA